MALVFNPFTGNFDNVIASSSEMSMSDGTLTVNGDINLDDGGAFSTTVQAVTPTANRTISFPDATGTVALVNGANGTIQYNDAGTLNGNSDFTVDLDWNDASTAFTGLKLNVTDTASAAGSNLLDLQVGGTSRFRIESGNQRVLANGYYIDTTIGYYLADGVNGSLGAGGFKGISTSSVSWVNSGNANSGTIDLALFRDDAGTLAQRNGTASQTFRLYNTWGNNGVDFERTSLTRDSSGLVIDAQKGGTGANPTNLLDVKLDGTSKLLLNNSGDVIPSRWLRLANSEVTIRGEGVYLASTSTIRFVNGSNTVGNTPDVGLARDSAGVLKITDGTTGTGYLRQEPIPVGDLPTAAPGNAGTRIFVSDSNVGAAGNFGAVVANGGSNVVPVYSDGGAWRIG